MYDHVAKAHLNRSALCTIPYTTICRMLSLPRKQDRPRSLLWYRRPAADAADDVQSSSGCYEGRAPAVLKVLKIGLFTQYIHPPSPPSDPQPFPSFREIPAIVNHL